MPHLMDKDDKSENENREEDAEENGHNSSD